MSKHNLVLQETFNPIGNSCLYLAQGDILSFALTDRLHQSIELVERVEHALMQSLAVLDEGNRSCERVLEIDKLGTRQDGCRVDRVEKSDIFGFGRVLRDIALMVIMIVVEYVA